MIATTLEETDDRINALKAENAALKEAFKKEYGYYPIADSMLWEGFQAGYAATITEMEKGWQLQLKEAWNSGFRAGLKETYSEDSPVLATVCGCHST